MPVPRTGPYGLQTRNEQAQKKQNWSKCRQPGLPKAGVIRVPIWFKNVECQGCACISCSQRQSRSLPIAFDIAMHTVRDLGLHVSAWPGQLIILISNLFIQTPQYDGIKSENGYGTAVTL